MELHTSVHLARWPIVTGLLIYLVYSTNGDLKSVLKQPRLARRARRREDLFVGWHGRLGVQVSQTRDPVEMSNHL
jgi:hypothetical protein